MTQDYGKPMFIIWVLTTITLFIAMGRATDKSFSSGQEEGFKRGFLTAVELSEDGIKDWKMFFEQQEKERAK